MGESVVAASLKDSRDLCGFVSAVLDRMRGLNGALPRVQDEAPCVICVLGFMSPAFLFCFRIARVVLALSVCVRSRERLCCRKNSSDTSKSTMRGRCGCEKATIDSLFVANRVFLVYKTPGHTNVPKLKTAVCRCLGELTCPESLICAFSLLVCDNMSSIGLSTTRLALACSAFDCLI